MARDIYRVKRTQEVLVRSESALGATAAALKFFDGKPCPIDLGEPLDGAEVSELNVSLEP